MLLRGKDAEEGRGFPHTRTQPVPVCAEGQGRLPAGGKVHSEPWLRLRMSGNPHATPGWGRRAEAREGGGGGSGSPGAG